jgi:NAD(P)-dependent dehydrogenase (short-subunit alcohol dehydrogenase family)
MKNRNRFATLLSRLKRSRQEPPSPGLSAESSADQKLLNGRTVLVTGGASNVGRGIAIESAMQGANVVIVDIDDEARASVERELAQYPGWVKGYHCDLSRMAAIDKLCETLQKDSILVDVLVNNVGVVYKTCSIADLDIDEWQKTFATNVFGPMYLTRCIAHSMIDKSRQGSILFITSIHQWVIRRYASYSASKGALGMIVKELAVDLAPYGIRVNAIAPGWVAEDVAGRPLPQRVALLHQCSIRPCYIGRAAVYLSADYYSLHTTGSVLKIDAGLSLNNYLVGR